MPLPNQKKEYTTDFIYSLPDGERAELIDGQIYYMAPPNRRHQEIIGEIFANIHNHIKSKGGTCKPYIAPFAEFLNKDDKTYVEPAIRGICEPNKLNDKGYAGAGYWIINIVSPARRQMG